MKLQAERPSVTMGLEPKTEYALYRVYKKHQPMYKYIGSDYQPHYSDKEFLENYGTIVFDSEDEIAEGIISSIIIESSIEEFNPLITSISIISKIILNWDILTADDIAELLDGRYFPLCDKFYYPEEELCSTSCPIAANEEAKCCEEWKDAAMWLDMGNKAESVYSLLRMYRKLVVEMVDQAGRKISNNDSLLERTESTIEN